jgi:hypothetical protein
MAKMAKKAVPQYKFATGFFALRAMLLTLSATPWW